ncbi:hypothetical protein BAUCODRAFT_312059 [Baudoinia panamericana UAMH 10762]|uniref:Uncharacterized protein n=1 Tax=Baudoinia panamericana (strain UAMH 10762) TaxID=717646 RepID=M2M5P7_BAUPA|nr:uncharacterized protein BAUCODRAFT_312059 [Baudoinia panamericana UAMH 10762]EMC91956.1 hypothetical protein BAUCODRAFT_312059 [Baudoinia panamericana UAMH 10762]
MFPSHQPTRPKLPTPPTQNPRFQQQSRSSSSDLGTKPESIGPRNQLEAMPPSKVPAPIAQVPSGSAVYNPAIVHPVFFSSSWRKSPFPLPTTAAFSPAAVGYVFGDRRPRGQSMTKL